MPGRRPNFVFVMADDLGYADLGCYGARADTTPVLDRMARDGVRFTDAYANSPVCSPTRFALMTGRYQYRLRGAAEEPIGGAARGRPDLGLPPAHPTLPSLLAAGGYHTALVGKWHLGYAPHFHPMKSGYAEFFGPLGGAVDYFSHRDWSGTHDLHDNGGEVERNGYLTDLLSARACDVVRERRDQPFLLSLHYTAPHWPWETRDDEAESRRIGARISHVDGGSVQTYRTMILQMDEGIGTLLETIAACGLDRDTLVVFTSDNGAERFSDAWPFVGHKMDLLEGGIRVPLIVRWRGAIASDATCAQHAMTMDWLPTLLEAAGVLADPRYPPDGISLLPALRDPSLTVARELHWRMKHRAQRAMRDRDWKYYAADGYEYLYNLAQDPRERANYREREPARFAAMRARHLAWEATMPSLPDDANVSFGYAPGDLAAG